MKLGNSFSMEIERRKKSVVICRFLTLTVIHIRSSLPIWCIFFAVAVGINYYRFSGLKQHRFMLLQSLRWGVWNRSHWGRIQVSVGPCSFVQTPGENHSLAFSSFQRLLAFFPSSKPAVAGRVRIVVHHSDIDSCSPLTNVDPCDYISCTQIIQNNLSPHLKASWLASLFPSSAALASSLYVTCHTGSGD